MLRIIELIVFAMFILADPTITAIFFKERTVRWLIEARERRKLLVILSLMIHAKPGLAGYIQTIRND